MKRIYIVALAVLLFLGIAVDLVIQRNRRLNKNGYASNAQSNAGAIPAPVETTLPAIDNAPLTPTGSYTAPVVNNYHGKHKRYARYYRKHKAHAGNELNDVPGNNPPYLAANIEPGEEVKLEKSKDYFGKEPKFKTTYEVRNNNDISDANHNHRVHFAPEFGLNQNGLHNDQTPNVSTVGFHAGAMANIALGASFALQPELMYIGKGNRIQNELDATTREQINLNYIELPVNIVAKIGDANSVRFLIGGGPYISYLFYAHDKFTASSEGDVLNAPVPYYQTNKIRPLDWGVGGFIGLETPEGLYAKVGTETGLTDIQQNPDGGYSNRNYTFFMTFGYLINY